MHVSQSVGLNYLTIPKLQWLHHSEKKNVYAISSHILQGRSILIHAGIKSEPSY